MIYRIIFAAVFLTALASPVGAKTLTLSPANAVVIFHVTHEFGYTIGNFEDFSATLELGDDNQVKSAKAQVNTASINTRGPARDEGLRSGLFLDTVKFPSATFEGTAAQAGEVLGTLTIKGVSKPMTFKVEQAGDKMVLKGSFNRNDYGMTYNKVLPKKKKSIGDTVDLIVELKPQ